MSTTPVAPAPPSRDPLYRGYRFPAEIISHAVWLCYRFALSHRDSEELLAERGVQVSYEAIRLWCQRFGPLFGGTLRRRRSRSADKWHLDEMQLKIKGKKHWLWRAADRDGLVLDILVQERRTQEAAERFLGAPRARGGGARGAGGGDRQTGQLPPPPALKRVLPHTEHRRHKGLNNRARFRTGRCGNERARDSGSRHRSTRSGSWSPSALSATTSASAATSSPLTSIDRSAPSASSSGGRSSGVHGRVRPAAAHPQPCTHAHTT